jgi:hypothetical protein
VDDDQARDLLPRREVVGIVVLFGQSAKWAMQAKTEASSRYDLVAPRSEDDDDDSDDGP